MASEAVATTLQVTRILEMLGIPYAIGGSMASTTHGRVRATVDVDIVADLQQSQVKPLLAQLGGDFYADEMAIRQAILDKSSFNLIHLTTFFKVDVFIAKNRAFDQEQLARRQPQVLEPPDHIAYVTSPSFSNFWMPRKNGAPPKPTLWVSPTHRFGPVSWPGTRGPRCPPTRSSNLYAAPCWIAWRA